MRTVIGIVCNCDSERKRLVIITEFCHEKLLWLPPGVDIAVSNRSLMDTDHVFLDGVILALPLDSQLWLIDTETEELLRLQVSRDLKLDDIFSLFDLICSDSQHASILSASDFLSFLARR